MINTDTVVCACILFILTIKDLLLLESSKELKNLLYNLKIKLLKNLTIIIMHCTNNYY